MPDFTRDFDKEPFGMRGEDKFTLVLYGVVAGWLSSLILPKLTDVANAVAACMP